jgi:hypothetical protein
MSPTKTPLTPLSGLPSQKQPDSYFGAIYTDSSVEAASSTTMNSIPATRRASVFYPLLFGVLLFILLNGLLTVGVTLSPLNKKFNFSYGNYLPTKIALLKTRSPQALDVLFLGTSQTNNGFIPSVFETKFQKTAAGSKLNAFNLGLPNNRYDIMQGYLQAHVQRYGKPRLVLVELGPSIQEKDAYFYYLSALYYRTLLENEPKLAGQWLSNPLLADNVKQELLFSAASVLHQYRFTFSPVNILSKVGGKLEEKVTSKLVAKLHGETVVANGEVPQAKGDPLTTPSAAVPANAPADTFPITPEMTEKGWYPNHPGPHMGSPEGIRLSVNEARKYYIDKQKAVHFDKLKALLTYCRKEHIPVVLVSWPMHPAFRRVFQQSPLYETYAHGLTALLAETPTPFINLNDFVPPQSETEAGLFADPRHLAPRGAAYFSGQLAQMLYEQKRIQPASLTASQR